MIQRLLLRGRGKSVVLISFYNKMTTKPQNDSIYGRNESIIYFFPFEWAFCPIAGAIRLFGWGKTPFVTQTVTSKPNPLEITYSNAEVFFVLLYLLIRNNKGRVAQNIRV